MYNNTYNVYYLHDKYIANPQPFFVKKINIYSGQFLMSANIGRGGKMHFRFVHFYHHPVIFLEKTDDVVGRPEIPTIYLSTFLRQKKNLIPIMCAIRYGDMYRSI